MPDGPGLIVLGCALASCVVILAGVTATQRSAETMLGKYDELLRAARDARSLPPDTERKPGSQD